MKNRTARVLKGVLATSAFGFCRSRRMNINTFRPAYIFRIVLSFLTITTVLAVIPVKDQPAHATATTRSRTVEFFAGQDVTASQNENQKYDFSAQTMKLAESSVVIKDAFVEVSAELSDPTATTYASSYIYFDSCVPSCTPATTAYTTTGSLGTNSLEAQWIRFRAPVTSETDLAAYTGGGANHNFQVGYCFATGASCSGATAANVHGVSAKLVVTYTYAASSTSETNTVRYPLESTSGTTATKTASQAACTMGTNCPTFAYNADIPELSTQVSQFFDAQSQSVGTGSTNQSLAAKIVGAGNSTQTAIVSQGRGGSGGGQGFLYSGLTGYQNNTAQSLELGTTNGTEYGFGGENVVTYTAAASAATKTKTISYPVGEVITANGSSAKSALTGSTVYLPESGVSIKKAWFRINPSPKNSLGTNTMQVTTKVGNNAETTAGAATATYTVNTDSTESSQDGYIDHLVPSADYSELAGAGGTGKSVQMSATLTSTVGDQGGAVSAELMITYQYTADTAGYITTQSVFAGQQTSASSTTFSTSAGAIDPAIPEGSEVIIRGTTLLSTPKLNQTTTAEAIGSNLTASGNTCTASNTSTIKTGVELSRARFYKSIPGIITNSDSATYTACSSSTEVSIYSGVLILTYQYNPNFAPNSPTSLAQAKTNGASLATGATTGQTSVAFSASATDPNSPDTVQLCVEKDVVGTAFSNTEDLCGTAVAYSGSAVTPTVTISGLTSLSSYHWQARLKDTAGLYSSWVSFGGNAESATDFAVDTSTDVGRTRTVEFFAGQQTGTTAANENVKVDFPTQAFQLAEANARIANAYVEVSAQASANTVALYASSFVYFDACVPSCTPSTAAFTSTGAIGGTGTESAYVRLRANVTSEADLAAYGGGGASRSFAVGYCFSTAATCSGSTSANVFAATAKLVITYTYNSTDATQTNTVLYPLESTTAGDTGSKVAAQAPCTIDTNCPKFAYNADIPEVGTQVSQHFNVRGTIDQATTTDAELTPQVDGSASGSLVHSEAALSGNGGWSDYRFSGLSGYLNNTAQNLEVGVTGATSVDALGGEDSVTYTYAANAATKTKTVSYPVGQVTTAVDNTTKSSLTGPTVYMPEAGVTIKKAWFRVHTAPDAAAGTLSVTTKVGSRAETSATNYTLVADATEVSDDGYLVHVIPSADYTELQAATAGTGKLAQMTAAWGVTNPGGAVSAELMITYQYTSDSNGYQTSERVFAGQQTSALATSYTTATGATDPTLFEPSAGTITIRGASLLENLINVGATANEPIGSNLSAGSCTASTSSTADTGTQPVRLMLWKDVTSTVTNSDAQTYTACDASTETSLFTNELTVTYQWVRTPSLNESSYRLFQNVDQGGFGSGGIVTGGSTSTAISASAKDSTYLYAVGTNSSGDWRIEKRLLSDGSLVSGFGTGGVVDDVTASNAAYGIAIDATYMYVVGDDATPDFRMEKRLLSDGSLVSGFGTGGVYTGITATTTAYGIAIDSTYAYVVGYAGNARIDKVNLSTGVASTTLSGVIASDRDYAVAIDSTYLYVAGKDDTPDWRIERHNLSDLANPASGWNTLTGATASGTAFGIAIDSTNMYVVGSDSTPDFRIEKRLLSDGSLVSGFGTSGVATGDSASDTLDEIVIDSTNMYVVGYNTTGATTRVEKRLLSNGSLVSGFGTSGVVTGSATTSGAWSVLADTNYLYVSTEDSTPDWRIERRSISDGSLAPGLPDQVPLAAQDTAYTMTSATNPFRLRMTVSPTVNSLYTGNQFKLKYATMAGGACGGGDETFSDVATGSGAIRYYDNTNITDGTSLWTDSDDPVYSGHTKVAQSYEEANNIPVGTDIPVGQDGLWDFALTPQYAPVGATYCFELTTSADVALDSYTVYPRITTFTPTTNQSSYRLFQNLDQPGFGTGGAVTSAAASNSAYASAKDSTYLYVAGHDGSSGSTDWRIEKRLLSDGSLVSGFGTAGVITSVTASEQVGAIVIDSTYMYVGGYDTTPDWRIEKRLLTDGSLVAAFGTSGVVTGAAASQQIYAMALDSTYLYAAGYDSNTDFRIEKRLLSNGSLVSGFGTSGVATGATASSQIKTMAIDSTYMYVGGYDSNTDWRIEKRLLSDGSLVSGFGTSGVATGAAASNFLYSMAIDSANMYLAGNDNNGDWRIEKRLLSDGSLVSGFGTSGAVTGAAVSQSPYAIALDSTNMYVGGYDSNTDWRIEKRLLSDGSLVTGFGTSGVATGSSTTDYLYSILLDSNYLYAVGFDNVPDWRVERRSLADGSLAGGPDQVPLAAQDTAYTLTSPTNPIRLRMTVAITGGQLNAGNALKLKFATMVGGACGGGDESFSDVATGSGAMRFYDNSNYTDGSTYYSDSDDPVYSGHTKVSQSYEEANNVSVGTDIPASQDGIWDFALTPQYAVSGATYCFEATWSDDSALNTYTAYPRITTYSTNTAPNAPTGLLQKTTGDVILPTGAWHNTQSIKFVATATDPDASDTLKLCVEKDVLGTSFSGTEDLCGTGVAYSGTGVTVSVTISGIADASQYHWQARLQDAAGVYSASWVSYDVNAESARDFGIDATAPTGGTVYDGTATNVDAGFNNGALDTLSANWSGFDANVSGTAIYEYSIGITAGGTTIKTWTSVGSAVFVNATGLSLQTGQMYYFNVRLTDNAGNLSGVVSSNGQMVAPTLSFTIGANALTIGGLSASNSFDVSQPLSMSASTNAYGGFVIRSFSTGVPSGPGGTIGWFDGGTYASPGPWGASTGYGYTSSDTSIQGADKFASGANYAPFSTTGPGDIVADHTAAVIGTAISSESFTITHRARVSATQPTGNYTTVLIYGATAVY